MKKFKPPLVEILWRDAVTYTGTWVFTEITARAKLQERTTVGYLLHRDLNGNVVVAGTIDVNEGEEIPEVTDVTVIPKGWVTSVTKTRRTTTKVNAKEKE